MAAWALLAPATSENVALQKVQAVAVAFAVARAVSAREY